jgi:hypothetical protein
VNEHAHLEILPAELVGGGARDGAGGGLRGRGGSFERGDGDARKGGEESGAGREREEGPSIHVGILCLFNHENVHL